jgi:SSS family solute:Na+ symporter
VFYRRITGRAAMTTLVGGFAIGMTRLVAELNKDALGGVALWFAELNFLHFAMLLFAVCVALLIGVSFTSPPPDPDSIRGLTYATTVAEERAASRATWGRAEVIHSVIIVVAILGILITFSPLVLGR